MAKKKDNVELSNQSVDTAAEALALAKANKTEIEELKSQTREALKSLENALTLLKDRNRLR
jgi:hypothetical protein